MIEMKFSLSILTNWILSTSTLLYNIKFKKPGFTPSSSKQYLKCFTFSFVEFNLQFGINTFNKKFRVLFELILYSNGTVKLGQIVSMMHS